jgi:hypothetical protein
MIPNAKGGRASRPHRGRVPVAAGTDAQHVPYRGSRPVFNDLLAGTVHFTVDIAGLIGPHHNAGTLRSPGTATLERSSELPDIPIFIERGCPRIAPAAGMPCSHRTTRPHQSLRAGRRQSRLRSPTRPSRSAWSGRGWCRCAFAPEKVQKFLAECPVTSGPDRAGDRRAGGLTPTPRAADQGAL